MSIIHKYFHFKITFTFCMCRHWLFPIAALLEVSTISMDEVRIKGVESKLYLAMDRNGRLYGEVTSNSLKCVEMNIHKRRSKICAHLILFFFLRCFCIVWVMWQPNLSIYICLPPTPPLPSHCLLTFFHLCDIVLISKYLHLTLIWACSNI
jgi:hypothetical protein